MSQTEQKRMFRKHGLNVPVAKTLVIIVNHHLMRFATVSCSMSSENLTNVIQFCFCWLGFAVKMIQITKIKSSCFIHSKAQFSSFGISFRMMRWCTKSYTEKCIYYGRKAQITRKIQFAVGNTCYWILYRIVICHQIESDFTQHWLCC